MRRIVLLAAVLATLAAAGSAKASRYIRFGIQDDAWLSYGDGTLASRLDRLDDLGVGVVRVTLNWNEVEPTRTTENWSRYDDLLNGLHERGIAPLVTLWGSPRWANGDRAPNWAPTSKWTFAGFARRAAERYPFVHMWGIWNEPNQRRWLRPTSAKVYVQKLLNPAYVAIHNATRNVQVAGGVTAPRGSTGGVSPVDWIADMARAHARLDAYAHNPYPLRPKETPTSGGCDHCMTITMATLDRLLTDVRRAFGTHTRIWLTEYGYQTNPPDRLLGVSYATQARYLSEAALRAYEAPRVDVLIHYLVRDEPDPARWQSGLLTVRDATKPAYQAFRFPLAERSRRGLRTVLWGQIRPGRRGTYRLQQFRGGRWQSVGGDYRTTVRGFFSRTVRAGKGSRLRVWIPQAHTYSPIVTVT
ncbi:MAG: hypothetical protein ACRDM1_07570 [Gaiellaceae bacterium]